MIELLAAWLNARQGLPVGFFMGDRASFSRFKLSKRTTASLVCAVSLLACSVSFADAPEAETIRIGVPPWQGAEVKSAVVGEILERAGYRVETVSAAAPLIFQELAAGRLDFNLSAWVPGQEAAFGSHVEAGDIVILGENLAGAATGLAIPAGLHGELPNSLDELADESDAFQQTIHCIEPGSGADAVVQEAVDRDLYGLEQWRVLSSSTEAMLTQVRRSISRDEAIVFCAWRPHWMNIAFDLRYLDDPLGHWGGAGDTRVYTLVRRGLLSDHPRLAVFLKNFRIDSATQSAWIHAYAQQERSLENIAREWIDAQAEQIEQWWSENAVFDDPH